MKLSQRVPSHFRGKCATPEDRRRTESTGRHAETSAVREATRWWSETQGAVGDGENSRSCATGEGRGGGRAPRSSAAISCGVVTARMTRMGPQQREQTEMSTRKTPAGASSRAGEKGQHRGAERAARW